jgi:hypothetical protein
MQKLPAILQSRAIRKGKLVNAKSTKPESIQIAPESWVEMLPILLMLLQNGDAKGKAKAKQELNRMAKVADMTVAALGTNTA